MLQSIKNYGICFPGITSEIDPEGSYEVKKHRGTEGKKTDVDKI